jgi:hypothetical protein
MRPSASMAATDTLASLFFVSCSRLGTDRLLRRRPSTCAASQRTAGGVSLVIKARVAASALPMLETSASTAEASLVSSPR